MEKGFFDRVNYRVNTTPTAIPLDVALLGLPIEEATCIDINHAVSCIAPSESAADTLSFAELADARVPIPNNNIFVQFHTAAAQIRSDFPGWLGVHIVPFEVARFSRLFLMLEEMPDRVETWHQGYALVIYREWPLEISLAPAGMLIGLDKNGSILDAAMFGISSDSTTEENEAWKHVATLTAWIVYLVFCVFTMINQGEAGLSRNGPGMWKI